LRRSSILVISAVSCILFGIAAVRLNSRFSLLQAQAAQPQTAPPNSTVAAAAPQAAHLSRSAPRFPQPPGPPTFLRQTFHLSLERCSTPRSAWDTISCPRPPVFKDHFFLTSSELADAIRQTNGNRSGNILKTGEPIAIPGILPAPIVEHTVPSPKILKFAPSTSPASWPRATTDSASSAIGEKLAAMPSSSISRFRRQRQHSLRAPPARQASGLYSRPAEVRALPALRKHARHRPHRHLPRRAHGS